MALAFRCCPELSMTIWSAYIRLEQVLSDPTPRPQVGMASHLGCQIDQGVFWKELAFFDGFCLGNFLPKSGSTDLGGVELAFVYAFGCLTQNAVKCFDFKRFTSCCKNQNI